MSKRPTIRDLAEASGVSIATVDRILNARHKVREATAQRVMQAAADLGYHATPLLRQRMLQERPSCHLGFLFQPAVRDFYQSIAEKTEKAARVNNLAHVTTQVEFAPLATPQILVEKLHLLAQKCHSIAIVAQDYPMLNPVIETLEKQGIPVFTLLSDVANGIRSAYIGLNNRKVGRTAAWFIAKTARLEQGAAQGKVACFIGTHRYHGHESREIGFRSYFREYAPQFDVVETVINLDAPNLTHEATLHLLKQHPDLVGIYVCGGGGEGTVSAIREAQIKKNLTIIVNELTPLSRTALAEGILSLVIDTPLTKLTQTTVDLMVQSAIQPETPLPSETFLPFDIYCPENI